jgi:hypothetical protein
MMSDNYTSVRMTKIKIIGTLSTGENFCHELLMGMQDSTVLQGTGLAVLNEVKYNCFLAFGLGSS